MRIAFDSWVLSSRLRCQGTYVYAQSLIAQLKKIAAHETTTELRLFTCPAAANDANSIEAAGSFELFPSRWLARDRLWRLVGANLAASRAGADVMFSPTSNIFPWGSVPVVCTIHDVTPVVMPSHSPKVIMMLRTLLWAAAKFSRGIITVSEHSRNDLVKRYGVAEDKISVVYNGYDKAVFNETLPDAVRLKTLRQKFSTSRPYIFHHGVIQPRKNLKRLIDAYRLLLSRKRTLELDLVLAGPLGWEHGEIVAAADGGCAQGRVVLTGALDAPDLAALIHGASLVVVPSLYEGFCLPMVEAMACGAPTIAANASCLPEVSGGVLRYFNPLEIEDMTACMDAVLEDSALRDELVRRGKQRATCFDWERCAAETLNVILRHARNGTN
ncbi:MAG TPA: glycosyltransferase family 1 protein [Candidatus Angelobacter sp.]|nr:glycosyltransferase family 1 protein [Candidatus Angelobacter sp.]